MTLKAIPYELRTWLCFDCEYCTHSDKGKECMLEKQYIYEDDYGNLICENRIENED